jgi:hypothetical protein
LASYTASGIRRIESFLKVVESGLDIFGRTPFSEFKLIDFPFDGELANRFFELLGDKIKFLDIRIKIVKGNHLSNFDGYLYCKIFSELAPNVERVTLFPFPNLAFPIAPASPFCMPKLHRIHLKEWASTSRIYSCQMLEGLFLACINLKELWISIGAMNGISTSNILNALSVSKRYLSVSSLHLAHAQRSHLELLTTMEGLQLESLLIELFCGDFDKSFISFEQFLYSQSRTLRQLYFRNCPNNLYSSDRLDFPIFPNLLQLDCELNPKWIKKFSCGERFPCLRVLKIHGSFNQEFDVSSTFQANFISETLTKLYFRQGLIITSECVRLLSMLFPSLKVLTLSIVDKEAFHQLWISWGKLEHLEVHYGKQVKSMDEALCGTEIDNFMRFTSNLNRLWNSVSAFELDSLDVGGLGTGLKAIDEAISKAAMSDDLGTNSTPLQRSIGNLSGTLPNFLFTTFTNTKLKTLSRRPEFRTQLSLSATSPQNQAHS